MVYLTEVFHVSHLSQASHTWPVIYFNWALETIGFNKASLLNQQIK